MKNIIFYISFLLTVLNNSISLSQDNISITEGSDTTICGKIVVVGALWVNEGILKADISLLEKQNSKPVTGGYKKGDETTISSEPGCTYYIYSITKYGSSGSIGMVTLSKSAPVVLPEMHDGRIKEYENKSILIGDYDFYVRKVFDNGKDIAANIKVTKNTALIEDLELKKGDYIWMGENLYQIENIAAAFRDKVKDPNGNYEWNPGYITFKVVQEYLPNR